MRLINNSLDFRSYVFDTIVDHSIDFQYMKNNCSNHIYDGPIAYFLEQDVMSLHLSIQPAGELMRTTKLFLIDKFGANSISENSLLYKLNVYNLLVSKGQLSEGSSASNDRRFIGTEVQIHNSTTKNEFAVDFKQKFDEFCSSMELYCSSGYQIEFRNSTKCPDTIFAEIYQQSNPTTKAKVVIKTDVFNQ